MLYLNNSLLTSDKIISHFETTLAKLSQVIPEGSKIPSELTQLKDKLKSIFFHELVGCDLVLSTVSPGEIDLTRLEKTRLEKKSPILIKQGDKCFIYGPSTSKNWILSELSSPVINQKNLNFPAEGADIELPCNMQYKSIYKEISSEKPNIQVKLNISLNKRPSDKEILDVLTTDDRFVSSYPKLKQVLSKIFALTDADDKPIALAELKSIEDNDWNIDNARARFDKLNTEHGYFTEDHFELFTELAIACRTMIVLFEQNNNPGDTLAYDYAYKLMALFVDPSSQIKINKLFDDISQKTHQLLKNSDDDKTHPFHDALLVKLPRLPNARNLADREGWCNVSN